MTDPKTLEEAIQIIKSLRRCGICKRNMEWSRPAGNYCEYKYDEWRKTDKPCRMENFEITASDSCEHWE